MHMETAQTAPVSEPTLALTMEARMERDSATLALLLPYSAVAPVVHRFSSRDDVAAHGDAREAAAVREAVGRVEMTVRAEVAAIDLPIEQVLGLQPGDVLRLDAARRGRRNALRRRRARPPRDARPQRRSPRAADHRAARRSGMTADEALVNLGESTTEAVCGVLEMFAPGQIRPGEVTVVADGKHPLDGIPVPAVATMVSYVDGVTGGNLFVMTVEGARRLAAAMMGMEPDELEAAAELTELELSAVAEAMNQMMASAAGATTAVLGTEVEIGVPETRTFTSIDAAMDAYVRTPHATRAAVSVCGEPCRLVQLVPNAFVVRMTRALDEAEYTAPDTGSGATAPTTLASGEPRDGMPSLAGISVRVCAELGRARMPSAEIVGLPSGAVVELNRQADEPIDLFVNGRHFATGRLMVVDGSDWAVRIESIVGEPENFNEKEVA